MKKVINQKLTQERIIQLRKRNGYTQDEIAEFLHGSRSYYCSLETGRTKLNEKVLERLSQIYNIEFDEICIYEESEYDILEKTMNILDSYRPTNYYMVRHGNLVEDLIDLIKYFEKANISEYKLLDPILNNLGFDVKLINIQDYIEKWKSEEDIKNPRDVIKKAKKLISYFDDNHIGSCILLAHREEKYLRYLISIDKYLELENYIYLSLVGNLEQIFENFNKLSKSYPKTISEELNSIIAENMQEEDHDNEIDKLLGYSQAKLHLLKINEYIGKILDMEDELKRNTKEKN
jgi:transcriptional regulator with XRE-family HTH domain